MSDKYRIVTGGRRFGKTKAFKEAVKRLKINRNFNIKIITKKNLNNE